MTTARELIYDALRDIQVTAVGEDPSAAEAADSLRKFNQLMHGLKAESIDLDWRDLTLDDDLPLPPEHVRGFTAMLAVEVSPGFGQEVPAAIAVIAERQREMLQAAYTDIPQLEFDPAYRRRVGWEDFDIESG